MDNRTIDILLVEDRAEDAELAMIALKENNLANNIKWVKDGQDALDYLFGEGQYKDRDSEVGPKLILLDLKMPKIDGLQVLRVIRDHELTKRTPVVVLTTSKEESDIIEAYDLGVNSYIIKPVEFDKFIESVKEMGMYWILLNEPPL